jgi:multimeric flavodoxin WrbA
MKKVIGLVGSPREGNTKFLVSLALEECEKLGLETELVHLGKMNISYCKACDQCKEKGECVIEDGFQKIAKKLEKADGIIIGSPVFFGCVSAQLKAFMDRTRYLRRKEALKDKVGGAIAVGASRQGGQESVLHQIHNFFLIHGMVTVGDENTMHFGGTAWGGEGNEIEKDEEGKETSRNLGRHVAKVVKKLGGD